MNHMHRAVSGELSGELRQTHEISCFKGLGHLLIYINICHNAFLGERNRLVIVSQRRSQRLMVILSDSAPSRPNQLVRLLQIDLTRWVCVQIRRERTRSASPALKTTDPLSGLMLIKIFFWRASRALYN